MLLDLLMSGLDGHGFLRAWQSDPSLGAVPVVIVSAAIAGDHCVDTGDDLAVRRTGGL